MRILPKILGACAIAALAGTPALATASPVQHHLTVWLPGGGSEQITYTGNVAPKLSFMPGDSALAPAAFWSPFAVDTMWMPMDRIAAAMDANMASMVGEVNAMLAMPAFRGMSETGLNAMLPGSQRYSVVSTISGNNVCTRSVEIIQEENGHAPKVVRHSSGNCAAGPDSSVLFQKLPSQNNHLTTIKDEAPLSTPSHPPI